MSLLELGLDFWPLSKLEANSYSILTKRAPLKYCKISALDIHDAESEETKLSIFRRDFVSIV